jgi:hypothetical protein
MDGEQVVPVLVAEHLLVQQGLGKGVLGMVVQSAAAAEPLALALALALEELGLSNFAEEHE